MQRAASRALAIVAACGLGMTFGAEARAETLQVLVPHAVKTLCPDLMEIETPLAEEESVKELGFKAEATQQHARMGTLDVVSLDADDGRIWLANSRVASFCQVGFEGPGAKTAFDTMLEDRVSLDNTLVPDTVTSPNENMQLVSLRTPTIDNIFYGVQFMDASALDSEAPFIIQQYLLQED